jgi:hypothetical protein
MRSEGGRWAAANAGESSRPTTGSSCSRFFVAGATELRGTQVGDPVRRLRGGEGEGDRHPGAHVVPQGRTLREGRHDGPLRLGPGRFACQAPGPGTRGARPPRLQFRRNRLREAAPGGVPPGPAHLGRRGRGGTACRRRRPGGGLRTGTLRQPRLARISPRPVTSDSRPVSPCSEPPTKEET